MLETTNTCSCINECNLCRLYFPRPSTLQHIMATKVVTVSLFVCCVLGLFFFLRQLLLTQPTENKEGLQNTVYCHLARVKCNNLVTPH